MSNCTTSGSRFPAPRQSRRGRKQSVRRSSTARRLGGAAALAALLLVLPAPALAAPAEASPLVSGAMVLDWIQGFLARLGVLQVPSAARPEAPTSIQERLGPGLDPDGAASYGDTSTSGGSETVSDEEAGPTTG